MERDNLRRRMAQHPRTVTFAEARRVLEAFGWTLDRIRGSHHHFTSPTGARLVIPLQRPTLQPVYVRQILAAIDKETHP